MKKVSFRLLLVVFIIPVLFACKKKIDCSTAWATDLQDELTAISNAITIYSMDQSDENCTALKAAYQDYIDALKPYGKCESLTGQSRTDWQNALDEAEADIDSYC